MADQRHQGKIITYSNGWIHPLEPDPENIEIGDIAHALSNQCRFTGHTKEFYSVAQHSVIVSEWLEHRYDDMDPSYGSEVLWGLLHDASEAYLSDIARPVKNTEPLKSVYHEAEDRLTRAIAEHFGLELPMPAVVTEADNVVLVTEARDLMHGIGGWSAEYQKIDMLPDVIQPWGPKRAKREFLARYEFLTKGIL